jgi:threonine dehydratase
VTTTGQGPAVLFAPTLNHVHEARERIAPHVHRTSVISSSTLDALSGKQLLFKCENFQRGGAFKARGAFNAVLTLPDEEARRGVLTHSSGNHGTALSLAARTRGIRAQVVVPETTSKTKLDNIRRYGGEIVFCKATLADREATAARLQDETGAHLVHSYDNAFIIAGQGTVALEFLEQEPALEVLIAPLGGGGLLAGVALAAKAMNPNIVVLGAEPEIADDAAQSLKSGKLVAYAYPPTVADGLRTSLSELTFSLLRRYVDDIITVSEQDIVAAMRLVWSVLKIVIEPSSAVAVSAALKPSTYLPRKRVGVVLSGGNVDLDEIPWLMHKVKT